MAKSDGVSRRCAEHAVLNTHITEHHPVAQQKPEAAKYNTCATFHDEWNELPIRRDIIVRTPKESAVTSKSSSKIGAFFATGPNAITGLTPSCAHPARRRAMVRRGHGIDERNRAGERRGPLRGRSGAASRGARRMDGSPCGDQARRRAGVRQEHALRGDRGREVRDGSAVVLRAVAQVAVWGVRF